MGTGTTRRLEEDANMKTKAKGEEQVRSLGW
jgi:hypothetical protein